MPIGGSATEFNITGAKLKVSGGVQVSGSIVYTTDATGFGGVTAQIDGNNTLNVTSGKLTGVTKIERSTAATITAITHTNVNNNTTIHIALKNTSSTRGVFITLGTFASDDTVKVNYTDDYLIGPGETGMLTLRKVNDVLSLFAREMFSSKATSFDATDNSPFYIKDGVNYKYPLYKYLATGLTSITINGTEYFKPSPAGITTKSRPPKGIPELIVTPTGNLAIGNNTAMTTINYDVHGTVNSEAGSIYRGSTQKTRFGLDMTHNEASGSFTDSGVSSGDTYTLYLDKNATTSTDTVSISSSGGWTGVLAFHHGAFSTSDYSSAYLTVGAAATDGRVYSDTSTTTTYLWGKVNSVTTTSDNTTYTWEQPNDISNAQIVVVGGGGGGGGSFEAGGGGAGGYKSLTGQNISGGNTTIVVGNGGAGAISYTVAPTNGENSSFGSTSVLGGGMGAGGVGGAATSGGSGGGGTHSYLTGASGTSGQGYAGGDGITVSTNWAGGGGGGAGGVGGNASSSAAGTGGTGVTNNFLGSSIEFSAGGNGGRRPQSSNGAAGTDHTGKGGGGGGNADGASYGGSGGSGIVIIKSDDASMGKTIAKVTGISFTSSNIVFTVQQDSGTSITHVKYTINGGSEVTTPVATLSVAHSLSSAASISVVAWAVDTSGNQLSAKKTVTGTIP